MSTIEHVLPVAPHGVFPWQRYLLDTVLAFGGVMLVTGTIYLFQLYPRIPNISIDLHCFGTGLYPTMDKTMFSSLQRSG